MFQIGDRVELSEYGVKWLLPTWRKKVRTGVVREIVTRRGDIITVQRDGVQKWDTEHADNWQAASPNKSFERTL